MFAFTLLKFSHYLLNSRIDGVGNSLFAFFKEGLLNVIIDLIQILDAKDKKIAILDFLFFKELSSFTDGIAVDKWVTGFYFKFLLDFIIVSLMSFELPFVEILADDKHYFGTDFKKYKDFIFVFILLQFLFMLLEPLLVVVKLQAYVKDQHFNYYFYHDLNPFMLWCYLGVSFSIMKFHEIDFVR